MLLSRLKNFIVNAFQKIYVSNIIRSIDRDIINKSNSSMIQEGWGQFDAKEIFGSSISQIAQKSINSNKIKYNNSGSWISREIDESVLKTILSSEKFEQIIFDYLGEDARLDDIYYWFKKELIIGENISGSWHDDNVGHRFKCYIGIDVSESAPVTEVVPKSHLKPYKFKIISEFKRYFNISESISNAKTKLLKHKKDVITIFDTNLFHRGVYLKTSGFRNVILLEFISRKKSNLICGKTPCGPGQKIDGEVIFNVKNESLLLQSKLIDKDILKKLSNGTFQYSISNLK